MKLNIHTHLSLSTGIYAAVLTPMFPDYRCNYEALFNHCNDLMNRGCQGIVLFGTTGEGSSFSVLEREQTLTYLVRHGIDPKKMILGISCCAIDDAAKLASLAVKFQCPAVLISPPFFYKNVNEEGVINFYKNIILSVNHPELKILLYHIPQCSGVPMTLKIIQSLISEFPQHVIGLKDSEGNLEFTKKILSTFDNFKVYVGKELHISEAVQLGAAGGISGTVNAFPELICSLYAYGKDQNKPNHNSTAKHLINTLHHFSIYPAIKAMVEYQKGEDWHVMRPPLIALNQQEREALIQLIAS